MAWIKLDHNVPRHPKIAGLSHLAFRWWIAGLCYASEFLTDGALPNVFIATVPRKAWEELIGADLWYVDDAGRLLIHDYLKHQTSKATIEQERRRNADRRTGGTTTGTPGGRTGKKPRPEDRRQKVEVVPPKSPADAGDSNRVIRRHLRQAEVILQSWMGYCKHLPECGTQVECLKVIARDLAQKEKAS